VEIDVTRQGELPIFRLKGRLSINGADEFEKQLVAAIDGGAKRVVFALEALDYISSAGLRVFYVGIKKLDNDGKRFAFAGLKPAVRSILDVVGLTSAIQVFPTEKDAVAAMSV
jgi:anti-anti-sigma factor